MNEKGIFMFKNEVRIIGWDDCRHKFHSRRVNIIGAIFRGGQFIDGLLSARIEKDGMDATQKIASAIVSSRHYDQLSIIMLDGITFGGFNIVDIKELQKATKLPVIAVQRKKPGMRPFMRALKTLKHYKKRQSAVNSAGKFFEYDAEGKNIFYQKSGITEQECMEILKMTCVRSNVPEPIRVAHIIASGLSGESMGRA